MIDARWIAVSVLLFGVAGVGLAAEGPVAVSPGDVTKLTLVESRCPTFSWSVAPGAEGYDLLVYRLRGQSQEMVPVLRQSIAGSASTWTPSVEHCLERGGQYGWLVRAVERGERSDWSPPSLFRVASGPSATDFSEALGIVRRYLESSQTGDGGPVGASDTSGKPADDERAPSAASAAPAALGTALGGADFSIDSLGNVLGASFGGDGSGLTGVDASSLEGEVGDFYRSWTNLTGVPLGFIDGIDHNSDTLALLSCANGQVAKTTASGWACAGDADTVAQLGCGADEVPQYTGAAWACRALTVDDVGAVIPGAPTHLRVGPEHRFPGMRRLAWNMPSLAGVASFVVYQSNLLITTANKSAAHRKSTPTLYAEVELFPNSATQHFRVEAVNVLGQPGPLSSPLLLNTTSHLGYIGDYDGPSQFGLYTVWAVSGGAKTRVSDPWTEYYRWAWSPIGKQVAYASNQGADSSIHVVFPSDTTPVRIDDPAAGSLFGFSWSWSPDGTRIAYRANPANPAVSWQLWAVPVTGGSAVRINDPTTTLVAEIPTPSWSPDGSRLLYGGSSEPGPVSLLSAPASGGGEIELSAAFPADAEGVVRAAWSPDGTRVAYLADQDTAFKRELWAVAASGDPRFKLNQEMAPLGTVSKFSWSPDGTRIAYTADLAGNTVTELFVVSPVGGPSLRLNEDLVAGGDVGQLEWSPDGKLIAYTADLTVDGVTELWVVPAVGGTGWRVSPTDSRGDPLSISEAGETWSPNGEHLAFVAGGELYVNRFDGSDLRKLSGTLVPNGAVSFARWSPDGSRLAYQADQDTDTLQELYVVGINGGDQVKLNDPFGTGHMGVSGFSWSPLGN